MVKTTRDILLTFHNRISVEAIYKTIQDSIQVVMSLGYRDLCIVQDEIYYFGREYTGGIDLPRLYLHQVGKLYRYEGGT